MMTNIRMDVLLIPLHTTTGASIRNAIKDNSNTLAVRLIKGPEYIYMFGSVEMS